MELTHRFTVPVGVEQTWAHFNDVASVAECFPGAQVTSAEGDSFAGTVKVKLGPIALVYGGSGTFVEKDEQLHRFVVVAKGKDKRGNGTAGATVTLSMEPSAGGAVNATDVEVATDLAITGKPAQFGRGVMQDVSDKLLGQFVACLEQRLGSAGSTATAVGAAEPTAEAATVEAPDVAAPTAETAPVTEPVPPPASPPPASRPPASPLAGGSPAAPNARGDNDALNLGSAVVPALAKAYWKQALAVLVILVVVLVLVL